MSHISRVRRSSLAEKIHAYADSAQSCCDFLRRGKDQSVATRANVENEPMIYSCRVESDGRGHSVNYFIKQKKTKKKQGKLLTGFFRAVIKLPVCNMK